MSGGRVRTLSVTPVKATRLQVVDSVDLEETGARGNRRFFVIDQRDRMVNSKILGALQKVVSEFDEASRRLSFRFPDGRVVQDEVGAGGDEIEVRFFSSARLARVIDGPWSQAVSDLVGQPLRLVDGGPAVDRGREGAVSLISRASLDRLASQAGVDDVDARRFRMLIEVDGVDAHAEDSWIGRPVQVGPAVLRFEGNVGRCLITSRDPDTGEVTLSTLDVLREYRSDVECTEPLPFGVYGRVLQGGRVSVGDPVAVGDPVIVSNV
ncbi:MAG TPA: MOSC domain-containing protein [Solirubrobacteraceae bacterium]|nr:MOSC domain-containing protein [Solirubrobacteraceae bacterium]